MRIAFYAPLKSPEHPVPSGDRLLARTFVAALRHAGHEVALASRLRSRDGEGNSLRQQRIRDIGVRLAARLVRRWRRSPSSAPQLWFSYHVYHKAPDWIGPMVSAALRIPYVVAEASIARKQRDGRWKLGHAAAAAAIRDADEVICINPADAAGLASARQGDRAAVRLAPFFDVDAFLATAGHASPADLPERSPPDAPRLIAVGMMRPGNKLASYRLLARALARIAHQPWQLIVVGDGEAGSEVRDAFSTFAADRVHFAGAQPHAAVASLLTAADLFVWPAVDEVIGMVLLEAQACGVPVVAGRTPGVEAVVADGVGGLLTAQGDDVAFAAAIENLLADANLRRALSLAGQRRVREDHDLPVAAAAIDAILVRAIARNALRKP